MSDHAPHPVEHLADNGGRCTARDTRDFVAALGRVPRLAPVRSPESDCMSEAFVTTLQRDCVRITPSTEARAGPSWNKDVEAVSRVSQAMDDTPPP